MGKWSLSMVGDRTRRLRFRADQRSRLWDTRCEPGCVAVTDKTLPSSGALRPCYCPDSQPGTGRRSASHPGFRRVTFRCLRTLFSLRPDLCANKAQLINLSYNVNSDASARLISGTVCSLAVPRLTALIVIASAPSMRC